MMNTLELVAEEHDPLIGTQLCARYRLDALLGRGAMGAVYRAWDLQRNAACAVKLLRVDSDMRVAAGRRFADEGRLVRQIFHPNIVEIFDQGISEDGSLFLVMELLSGQDLDEVLSERRRLSLRQAQDIVYQIGSALHAVHQVGIVHRDIKPRNVFLLTPSIGGFEESPRVKVIDFGLAKYLEERHVNRGSDGMLIGTPEYLAPESWTGVSAHVDTRADQWALAVLAFRLLSGRLPFDSQLDTLRLGREIVSGTPRALRDLVPEVPEYVERALMRALSKEKHERYGNIRDFVWAFTARPLNPSTLFSGDTAIRKVPVELVAEPVAAEETRRLAIDVPLPNEGTTVMVEGEVVGTRALAGAADEAESERTTRWAGPVPGATLDDDEQPQTQHIPWGAASMQTPSFARGQSTQRSLRTSLLFALHLMQALLTIGLGLYLTIGLRTRPGALASASSPAVGSALAASEASPSFSSGSKPVSAGVPAAARVGASAGAATDSAASAATATLPGSALPRAAATHPTDDKTPRKRVVSRPRSFRGLPSVFFQPPGELRPWPATLLPMARRQRPWETSLLP